MRTSRSFPFVSKTLDCDLVALATRCIMKQPLDLPSDLVIAVPTGMDGAKSTLLLTGHGNRVGVKVFYIQAKFISVLTKILMSSFQICMIIVRSCVTGKLELDEQKFVNANLNSISKTA